MSLLAKGAIVINGPSATAVVYERRFIEPVIAALCLASGDDQEDYTATDWENPRGTEN